jgi:hypothetical protein
VWTYPRPFSGGLVDEDEIHPEQPVPWAIEWGMRICTAHEGSRRRGADSISGSTVVAWPALEAETLLCGVPMR